MEISATVDRIAVEAAVWLEALLYGGPAEELVKMGLTGRIHIISTDLEVERLLAALCRRLGFSEAAAAEVRTFIEDCAEILPVVTPPAAGQPDETPSILQAARAAEVNAIATTGRSRLLELGDFEGIPIVSVV